MKRSTFVFSTLLVLTALPPGDARGNEWSNRGGMLNPGGGWFDWVQNTVDGRHCALGYGGSLQCYDPGTNTLETVYVNASQTPDPQNGDLQIFGWDHVNQEYLAMDGGRTIGPNPMAFSMITRTWRILTNADFDGIEARTKSGAPDRRRRPTTICLSCLQGRTPAILGARRSFSTSGTVRTGSKCARLDARAKPHAGTAFVHLLVA